MDCSWNNFSIPKALQAVDPPNISNIQEPEEGCRAESPIAYFEECQGITRNRWIAAIKEASNQRWKLQTSTFHFLLC